MSDDAVNRAQALLESADDFDVEEANDRLAAADRRLDEDRQLKEGAMSAFRAGDEVPDSYRDIDGYKDGVLLNAGMAIMNEEGRVSTFKHDLSNQTKLDAESVKALHDLLMRN